MLDGNECRTHYILLNANGFIFSNGFSRDTHKVLKNTRLKINIKPIKKKKLR